MRRANVACSTPHIHVAAVTVAVRSSFAQMNAASPSNNAPSVAGISGLALHVPRPRVDLRRFAGWTGADPGKLAAVIGDAFRVPQPDENVYTLAAASALRLIDAYAIAPEKVGMLALGTESSTDNAVGAVIVR